MITMYDIHQIAQIIGKSDRTVLNDIKKLNLKPSLIEGNKWYFDTDTVKIICDSRKIAFPEDEPKEEEDTAQLHENARNFTQFHETARNEENPYISLLEQQITFLQSQLTSKDAQIDNLNTLLSQEQKLNLLNAQIINDLRAQLPLKSSAETVETPIEPVRNEETPKEEPKKSFWQRLFG